MGIGEDIKVKGKEQHIYMELRYSAWCFAEHHAPDYFYLHDTKNKDIVPNKYKRFVDKTDNVETDCYYLT